MHKGRWAAHRPRGRRPRSQCYPVKVRIRQSDDVRMRQSDVIRIGQSDVIRIGQSDVIRIWHSDDLRISKVFLDKSHLPH